MKPEELALSCEGVGGLSGSYLTRAFEAAYWRASKFI